MKILDFAGVLVKLKKLKRSGWLNHHVPNPESVAEHSYSVALLAMFFAPKLGVDQEKVIKMALLHDMGEAEIGDIVTMAGKKILPSIKNKKQMERNALKNILQFVDSEESISLFDEYDRNETKEAQLVKQLDKLEMALQAYAYENEYKIDLSEFYEASEVKIHDPFIKEILNEIRSLRSV